MTLDLHGEGLRAADVDVLDRQIHAVAGQVSTQRFDGGKTVVMPGLYWIF